MSKRRSRDVTIGAIFALALIILAITVMAVGEESRLLGKKSAFLVVFPSTDGLGVGSPVKMAGVQIGTVTGIRLPTDPTTTGIKVQRASLQLPPRRRWDPVHLHPRRLQQNLTSSTPTDART